LSRVAGFWAWPTAARWLSKYFPGNCWENVLPTGHHYDEVLEEAVARLKALFERGLLLDRETLQQRLGTSDAAQRGRLRRRSLFHVDGPSGARYYLVFFADPTYSPVALAAVSRALGTLPGGAKWVFFTSPRHSLGALRPLAIIAGKKPPGNTGSGVDLEWIFRLAAAKIDF